MVSVLQTMSSVIYSIFLLRKSFTWPAPCQVVWRKDELLGLTRDASATGVKTQQLVRSRLVSQWHGPSQPFHTKIGITVLFKLNNSHTPGNRIFQHSARCSRPQDTLFIHPFMGVRVWAPSLMEPPSQNHFLGARFTVPWSKREKGPPGSASKNNGSAQLKTPVLKILGGGGSRSHLPLKYTHGSASTTADVIVKVFK